MIGLQTEFKFTLPRGYIDREGNLHKDGVMRLSTAMDEIVPLQDQRVRQNQAYLVIILLSRVVIRLGALPAITPSIIENLFAADLAYLQTLYRQINEEGTTVIFVTCPHCQKEIEVDLAGLGEKL